MTGALIEICLAIISEEINKRTLFIKNFPPGIEATELKGLSKDIQSVTKLFSDQKKKAFW